MILKNLEQINQIMTDMFQAFQLLPIDAREFLFQKLTDDMAKLNNTSIYTYRVFRKFYTQARQYGLDVSNASILELGAGKPLGTGIFWNYVGAGKYTAIDRHNQINLDEIWLTRFRDILGMNMFNPYGFQLDTLIRDNGDTTYTVDNGRMSLIQGVFDEHPFEAGSFDFIYSNAALEHFPSMEDQISKMFQVSSENGIMIHQIDLRQHRTDRVHVPDVKNSVEFLRYSPEEWNDIYPAGSIQYVNRLRASDYEKMFASSGFTVVASITNARMDLDETVYEKIHPFFHRYSIDDLSRTGIFLVLRKTR